MFNISPSTIVVKFRRPEFGFGRRPWRAKLSHLLTEHMSLDVSNLCVEYMLPPAGKSCAETCGIFNFLIFQYMQGYFHIPACPMKPEMCIICSKAIYMPNRECKISRNHQFIPHHLIHINKIDIYCAINITCKILGSVLLRAINSTTLFWIIGVIVIMNSGRIFASLCLASTIGSILRGR